MTKLFVIYAFLIYLNPVIKPTTCAASDRNWSNTFRGARRTTFSALVDEGDLDDWQPAVQPQNWLITTSATVPLSLTSSRLGERERISLMFERQQEQHQHILPNHFYAYSHHNGNYTKRQTAALSSSPSATLDQPAQMTANLKLKPYVATSRESNNDHNYNHNSNSNANNINYRRLNPKKQYPLTADPYPQISKESSVISQSERRRDVSKHFRPDNNRQTQHPNHDDMMSPILIESHLSHIPATATTTGSFIRNSNVNNKETPTTTATILSNKIDDENINEILLPLHAALDTVKQFCDFIKDIITDDKDDKDDRDDKDDDTDTDDDAEADDKDSSNEENTNNATETETLNLLPILTAVKALLMKTAVQDLSYSISPTTATVQDQGHAETRNQVEPSSTSTRSLDASKSFHAMSSLTSPTLPEQESSETDAGRARRLRRRKVRLPPIFGHRGRVKRKKAKKKIKRKFKKYMFPLLIAYKLMFLALIPTLVGGLTLLVGSTGMAGFFFALFAAVMTIRRGRAAAYDANVSDSGQ